MHVGYQIIYQPLFLWVTDHWTEQWREMSVEIRRVTEYAIDQPANSRARFFPLQNTLMSQWHSLNLEREPPTWRPQILDQWESLARTTFPVHTPRVRIKLASCDVERVIITHELDCRPSKSPDFKRESQAFVALAKSMSSDPATVLQRLAETVISLTHCGSAGITLLEPDAEQGTFRWVAMSGAWAPDPHNRVSRSKSPCGTVIAGGAVVLLENPARAFPALLQAEPALAEAILAPFNIAGVPSGTVWAIMHDQARQFDAEDARVLESLAQFASIAYEAVLSQVAARDKIRLLQNELIHLSRNSAMESMAATIAHEVNQPLLAAVMYAGGVRAQMNAGARPNDVVEGLDGIERALMLAGDIIRRIRESARGHQPKIERVHSSALVRETIRYVGDVCSNTELKLQLDDEAFVFCDAVQIEQVLMNLIKNACEATRGRATPVVIVRTVAGDDQLRFEVEDNGPGFNSQQPQVLFETVSSTKPDGMGIGLAISRTIVEAHGSALKAESVEPIGARVFFYLPTETSASITPETDSEQRQMLGRVLSDSEIQTKG